MFAGICEPFLSSDYMSNFHFPIINHIGKVKRWPSIFFYNNKVIKLDKVHRSIVLVNKKRWGLKNISLYPYSIRFPFKYAFLNLLHSKFWASTIIWCRSELTIFVLVIILLILVWLLFSFFLNFAVRFSFSLMLTKAWISKIIFQ